MRALAHRKRLPAGALPRRRAPLQQRRAAPDRTRPAERCLAAVFRSLRVQWPLGAGHPRLAIQQALTLEVLAIQVLALQVPTRKALALQPWARKVPRWRAPVREAQARRALRWKAPALEVPAWKVPAWGAPVLKSPRLEALQA